MKVICCKINYKLIEINISRNKIWDSYVFSRSLVFRCVCGQMCLTCLQSDRVLKHVKMEIA